MIFLAFGSLEKNFLLLVALKKGIQQIVKRAGGLSSSILWRMKPNIPINSKALMKNIRTPVSLFVPLAFALFLSAAQGFLSPPTRASFTNPAQVGTGSRPELVLQTGHAMRVDSLAFSPEGQLLASGSGDNTVKLWDVATKREVRSLTGHARGIRAVAFSQDGKLLASGSVDGSVKFWDVATGREVRSLLEAGSVSAVAFSADGRSFASGNMENAVKIWDVQTGAARAVLGGHGGPITAVVFSPDSQTLATASADKTIKLWETATGKELRTLTGHTDKVKALDFSPNGELLASGGLDSAVKIWKASNGREQKTLNAPGKVIAVAFSQDGKRLFAGSSNNAVRLWDVQTWGESQNNSGSNGEPRLEAIAMAFSHDGSWTALSSGDKTITLRDRATGQDVHTLSTHSYGVAAVVFSPEGRWFATGGKENTVKLWETQTGRELRTLDPNSGFINAVTFSPDGSLLAAAGLSGATTIWETATGQKVRSLAGHTSSVNQLAFSPDGKWLATASGDNTAKIWETKTGLEARTLTGHSAEIYALAFSPDGQMLATGSADKSIKLWETATGKELRTLTGHTAEVGATAFSPDGKWLASSSADKTIKLWETATGKELRTLTGHAAEVKAVAFSPDGRVLASGSKDNAVKLWEAATGKELRTLTGHSSEVYSVSFSRDGRWFASGSEDGSSRIWDAGTGQLAATLVSLRESAEGLAAEHTDWLVVSPDGLFDGSPAAWGQILWRFEQNTLNVRPVEVFFNEFFYPGLLADILARKNPRAPKDITRLDRRQPSIAVRVGAEGSQGEKVESVATRELAVKIEVDEAPPDSHHATGSGARDVRLFRNGSLVKVWRGDVLNGGGKAVLDVTIPVIAGKNQLNVYAFNRDNIKSADNTLSINGASSLKQPATAYILAIGVNTYANPQYNLKFAVPDANEFSDEVRRSQQNLLGRFSNIEVIPLLDQQATKANIMSALNRLAGIDTNTLMAGAPAELSKLKPAQPEDAVIIYFAGHGLAHQARFYLLPHDLGYQGSRRRLDEAGFQSILAHSISDLEMEGAFEKISAGQLLLVLDACNSGQALEAEEKRRGPMNSKGLAQLAYEKGMYILTAAQSYQAALEATQLGHGLLTYALVEEGLKKSAADRAPRDGQVLLQEWLDYATERVPQMQVEKMKQGRSVGAEVAFVEGEEQMSDMEKRSLQRPRAFYRRDTPVPLIAIKR